ncbi:hypothetical protein PTKIN_Ptkin14bG0164200 [Pterospermum kingtungense]
MWMKAIKKELNVWWRIRAGWKEFAIPSPFRNRKLCDGSTNPNLEPICGRPLRLKFNTATCHLYIADAYFGLLELGPNGGVAKQNPTSAEGVPFRFTNGLDIDTNTESGRMRVLRFNLEGEEQGHDPKVFAQLPRVPDNIKRNEKGEFWVALNTRRTWRIVIDAPDPIGIKYDVEGNVLQQLDGKGGFTFNSISEVKEFNGRLYIGSVTKPYVSILNA